EPEDLLGRPALDLIHPDDLALAAPALAVELTGAEQVSPVEVRICSRDGRYLWFEVLANGWIEDPGVRGLVLSLRESTGRHELAALAARRAELDRLVFDVSRRTLDAALADVTRALPVILAQLGRLLGADRAYGILFDSAHGRATVTASWTADAESSDATGGGSTAGHDRTPRLHAPPTLA